MTPKERAAMELALDVTIVALNDIATVYPTSNITVWHKSRAREALIKVKEIRETFEALDHSGEANEMVDCYQEVYDALETQLIKEPIGNGLDQVAQNNGLIIAMNTLQKMNLAKQADMNLSCKSVQKRLATLWGYVKAEQAEQEPVTISCECGDIYERNSFGGRFIKLHGICPNCDAALQAAPVRTKDLTDDEKQFYVDKWERTTDYPTVDYLIDAVIAADRKLNK